MTLDFYLSFYLSVNHFVYFFFILIRYLDLDRKNRLHHHYIITKQKKRKKETISVRYCLAFERDRIQSASLLFFFLCSFQLNCFCFWSFTWETPVYRMIQLSSSFQRRWTRIIHSKMLTKKNQFNDEVTNKFIDIFWFELFTRSWEIVIWFYFFARDLFNCLRFHFWIINRIKNDKRSMKIIKLIFVQRALGGKGKKIERKRLIKMSRISRRHTRQH